MEIKVVQHLVRFGSPGFKLRQIWLIRHETCAWSTGSPRS